MFGEYLNYSGVAWPSAQVLAKAPGEFSFFQPVITEPPFDPPPEPARWLQITSGGHEKHWTTTSPRAFWRSFGELAPDPSYDERAVDFVRRFGPLGEQADRRGTITAWWPTSYFAEVAKSWEPEDASGISRLSPDRRRRDVALDSLSGYLLPMTMRDVDVVFDAKLRPELRARTLYAFMALSAASMFRRQALMRRCGHCRIWFEPTRIDALYCSNACRVAHHVAHTRPDRTARRPHIQTQKKVRRRG